MNQQTTAPRFGEFVALMALMMSLVALSIDAMLPALPEIGRDLGVTGKNDSQLVISALFAGLAIGQLIYGPLSDSRGRKPAIYLGFSLFLIGTLCSFFASSFSVMLTGRFLQGLGAAGPRIVSVALVRDQYAGRAMARVMSFVMTIFILVPIIAPVLGQAILLIAHWRAIFALFLLLALIVLIWFSIRQPETLTPDRRIPLSLKKMIIETREICTNRVAFGYAITAGLIFASFLGYLNTAQQLFQDQYGLGTQFPLYFALLAVSIGSATLVNARLVMHYGMHMLSRWALFMVSLLSIVFLVFAYMQQGHPALWMLMVYLLICFFCIGILFGNLNALAMEPLGHIAGMGAAVVGSLSTFISVPLGMLIGYNFNGTVLPVVAGFAVLGTLSLLVARWTEQN